LTNNTSTRVGIADGVAEDGTNHQSAIRFKTSTRLTSHLTQSKQYLQTLTIPNAHPTDIFSLATTPTHLLTASGSSSIKIYRTTSRTIHADSTEDENPYPLAQTLEGVHKLGCHHICAAAEGNMAASVGFAGEVKVWKFESRDGDTKDGSWEEKGEIIVGAREFLPSYLRAPVY
jgi:superkiller protein 8